MLRMHGDQAFNVVKNVVEPDIVRENPKPKKNIIDVLKSINLLLYSEIFLNKNIDLEILKSLNDSEYV